MSIWNWSNEPTRLQITIKANLGMKSTGDLTGLKCIVRFLK